MDVEKAIRSRVSVREYEPRAVPREQIERLLEVAILAPNHRMTQPVEFRVMGPRSKRVYGEALAARKTRKVEDPEAAQAVSEKVVRERMEVPVMIGIVMDQAENPEIREEDYATAFMVVQNLSLMAVAAGLATHIKTGAVMEDPPVREALKVGKDQRLVAVVYLGEPAELPDLKKRVPASKRTRWLP